MYGVLQPWLISGTLRENVIFGLPYDNEKFWDTLEVHFRPNIYIRCARTACIYRNFFPTILR